MRSAIAMIALVLPLLAGCNQAQDSGNQPRWEQLDSSEESSLSMVKNNEPVAPIVQPSPPRIALPRPETSSKALPATFRIPVPFMSQAPQANWDDPYQEACEEASLLMVHRYLQKDTHAVIPPEDADRDLLALIRWETNKGYSEDVTLEQLGEVAKQYYGYSPVIEDSVTVARIKELLVAGYPVIVPIAGRDLGNPYFSGEGPWYHMLVIVGYDRNEFITNEPGTRRGEGYKYAYDVLISAIHDWTGVKEEIRSGKKRMMILKK